MGLLIAGLMFIVFVAFCVLLWKAASDWRWYQIVPVVFIMIFSMILPFPTANALKSRKEWHKLKEDLEARYERVKVERTELKYGDPSDPNSIGVVQLSQQLKKLGSEAGRRWPSLRVSNLGADSVTLVKTQPAEPVIPGLAPDPAADAGGDAEAADAEPAAPAALLPEAMVVYAFKEAMDPAINAAVPVDYLGEFKVTAADPNQATLKPTLPLDPDQVQRIQGAQNWVLYEMLPLDGHEPFIAAGSQRNEDNWLGRVDEELVRRLLPDVGDEVLQRYLRDGSRATQDDPKLSVWVLLEFTTKWSIQVDSPDQVDALQGRLFDGNGRALDSRLQRGEEVSFNTGDQVLMKEEGAQELLDNETARLIDRYYLRPGNDYRFSLNRIRLRIRELGRRKAELAVEKAALDKAIAKTRNMFQANQTAKLKLEEDYTQVQLERQSIEKYSQDAAARVKTMRQEMVRLHRSNLELERKLRELHLQIEQNVNSLTLAR